MPQRIGVQIRSARSRGQLPPQVPHAAPSLSRKRVFRVFFAGPRAGCQPRVQYLRPPHPAAANSVNRLFGLAGAGPSQRERHRVTSVSASSSPLAQGFRPLCGSRPSARVLPCVSCGSTIGQLQAQRFQRSSLSPPSRVSSSRTVFPPARLPTVAAKGLAFGRG